MSGFAVARKKRHPLGPAGYQNSPGLQLFQQALPDRVQIVLIDNPMPVGEPGLVMVRGYQGNLDITVKVGILGVNRDKFVLFVANAYYCFLL